MHGNDVVKYAKLDNNQELNALLMTGTRSGQSYLKKYKQFSMPWYRNESPAIHQTNDQQSIEKANNSLFWCAGQYLQVFNDWYSILHILPHHSHAYCK